MKIVYLTNCFGSRSHTFIRREVFELRKLGVDITLYGVRRDSNENIADDGKALVEETHYLYPLSIVQILLANLYYAVLRPQRYWPALCESLFSSERNLKRRLKMSYHFFVASAHARKMQKQGINHIHAHFLNVSTSIAMYCSLLSGIPYSSTVHSAGTKDAPHIIGIPMKLKHAKLLTMISHYNIQYFNDIYPCKDKSHVVRCGMDLHHFPYKAPAEHGPLDSSSSAPLKVLAVGRFVEKKGFIYLVEAAKLLKDKNIPLAIEILGFGPLEDEIKDKISAYGLEDNVHLPGQVSTEQVREKMLGSDVVVIPSVTSASGEMEGIPVVIMEAMALGIPVIGSAHSGIPELIQSGKTGSLVEERDAEGLAAALESLSKRFSEDGEAVGTEISSARQLIENEFNIEIVAQTRKQLFSENLG